MNAIVTGGSRGIGKAIVEELAKLGINIVANYNKSQGKAEELKRNLTNQGYNIEIYKADVSNKDEVKKLVNFAKNTFGEIDILINNAGIDECKLFTEITDEDWNLMINTNLNSVFYTTREIVPDMIKNKKGCIINISSVDGITGASCEVHYSVSKAAIDGLTKALAKELAPSNIRVNAIAPGAILTDMTKNLSNEDIKEVEKEIPMGRFGTPKEVAKWVGWLIQDTYTTGQIISPNGGWYI